MSEQYKELNRTLTKAYHQSSTGKGKERHANNRPFEQQDICEITRNVGLGFPLGQAVKKINESVRVGGKEFMERELLGAIVYIAAAIIVNNEGVLPKKCTCPPKGSIADRKQQWSQSCK